MQRQSRKPSGTGIYYVSGTCPLSLMIDFNPKKIKRWMMMGTRNAFGAFLTEVAANHPELFAMTADQ